ncbi:phosphoinositide 5-phosphatase [Nesidiocoris tenuis]|uniref:phosphoinositide 5-phosphatase n=1 Tax=Nesidiocoris tenuis TaxID=355587 RepID=A0ABN7AN59_9HEMI|nr:phosphoinositide 5-phosphatase [Nesidiocoris tenuis]
MAMGKSFRVLEREIGGAPYSLLIEQRNRDTCLLIESDAIISLSALEKDAIKRGYSKVLDAYGSLGILQINVGLDLVSYLVMITGCISLGKIAETEVFRITQTSFLSTRKQHQDDEHVSEVKKLLNSGTFYFSWSGSGEEQDITLCAQRRTKTTATDNRFFWNRTLHLPFVRYGINTSAWLQKVMAGSVEIRTVYVGARQGKAVIISRLSCERTGTRFHVRGVNDEGHVANFVETEQAIFMEDCVASYVQTRGSVPLFWEQTGVQVGQHKVRMSRGVECSMPAFERHIASIKQRYGHQTIVNLLGTSQVGAKESEGMLSHLYVDALQKTPIGHDITHIVFDYHQEMKVSGPKSLQKLKEKAEPFFKAYGIFYSKGNQVLCEQSGTIRTNCLDCLDRTNCVQTFFGLQVMMKQLEMLDLLEKQQSIARFEEVFKQMWVDNGNEVSKIYAGTGAIQGGSKFMDGARSAARTIQNNLLDTSKQEAIDVILLGKALNSNLADRARTLLEPPIVHLTNNIISELTERYLEYVETKELLIGVGTYNVNGGKHFRSVVYKDVTLADWLLDNPGLNTDQPKDIYAIGFEEIVDLNASNIMAVSTENARLWADELTKVLSRDTPYVMVTYIQLVGVCLFLFIRPELAPVLRDVAVDSVKTGFGGATGNKGGVAIRCTVYNTSLTFLCAHFAAGQSQVNERNSDYNEITKKILFPLGSNLKSQDYIIWCGDFNYRIDLDKEEVKELVRNQELQKLFESDQLKIQKDAGNVFQNFNEGDINFAPTYKYDLFSDDYDTSEKCRAPAWTDRVLWHRQLHTEEPPDDWTEGELLYYGRCELKQSDHRPVLAVLRIPVHKVQEGQRDEHFKQVIKSSGPGDATAVIQVPSGKSLYTDELFKNSLLDNLSQYGDVVILRQVENEIKVVFRDSFSALLAIEAGATIVNGERLAVTASNPTWPELVWEEIKLLSNNTIPLCAYREVKGIGLPPTRPPPPSPARPPRPLPPQAAPAPSSPGPQRTLKSVSSSISSVDDDYISAPAPQGPPPPPPQHQIPGNPTPPATAPPPIPPRNNIPPPLPSRPR